MDDKKFDIHAESEKWLEPFGIWCNGTESGKWLYIEDMDYKNFDIHAQSKKWREQFEIWY